MGHNPKEAQPSCEEKFRLAARYLDSTWPRTFEFLKKHNPNVQPNYYDIAVNVSASPKLQQAIDEIAEGYKEGMLKKGMVKIQVAALEREAPSAIRRIWSKEAKGKMADIQKTKEPLEQQFVQLQIGLCQHNIKSYERLVELVEEAYDKPTRAKLGEAVHEQARCDAYVILGKMIQRVVEVFNESFVRHGVEEFGVPKNLDDPRQQRTK